MSNIAVSAQTKRTSEGESIGFLAILRDVFRTVLGVSLPESEPTNGQAGEFLNQIEQLADRKAERVYQYIRSPLPAEYMKPLNEEDLKFMASLSLFERGVLRHFFVDEIREWIMGKPLLDGFRRFGEIRRKDNFLKAEDFGGFCYLMTRSRHEKRQIFMSLPKEMGLLFRAYGIDAAEELGEKDPMFVLEEFRRMKKREIRAITTPKPRVETMEELSTRRVAEFAEIDREFEAGRPEAGFQKASEFFGPSKA